MKSFCYKKKKSLIQLRREDKRRNNREQPKATVIVTENISVPESTKVSDVYKIDGVECPQCALRFKSDKGLRIHI